MCASTPKRRMPTKSRPQLNARGPQRSTPYNPHERRPKLMDPAAALSKIGYTLLSYRIYPIFVGPPTQAFHMQTFLLFAHVCALVYFLPAD